jgi:RNA 2',3'-cyclic 3'-phosphodiesterase
MSQRTFLALDLEEATLDYLARVQEELCKGQSNVRPVDRDNLHLTLIFLGDVHDDLLPQVCDLAAASAGLVQPFEYQVRGVECVPPSGPLRMIWAGVLDPTGRLGELAEHLRLALAGLGLHEETRSFHPHITLARVKSDRDHGRGGYAGRGGRSIHGSPSMRGSRAMQGEDAVRQAAATHAQTDFGPQFADEIVIYGSHLTPQGPVYTPTAKARLGN